MKHLCSISVKRLFQDSFIVHPGATTVTPVGSAVPPGINPRISKLDNNTFIMKDGTNLASHFYLSSKTFLRSLGTEGEFTSCFSKSPQIVNKVKRLFITKVLKHSKTMHSYSTCWHEKLEGAFTIICR